MDWIQELTQKESLCCSLATFLDQHGFSGLEKALQLYSNTQAEYIYKTKATVTRIKIDDIDYLEIQTHTITIHTEHGNYQKYGSVTIWIYQVQAKLPRLFGEDPQHLRRYYYFDQPPPASHEPALCAKGSGGLCTKPCFKIKRILFYCFDVKCPLFL